jgi:hypothetical protein
MNTYRKLSVMVSTRAILAVLAVLAGNLPPGGQAGQPRQPAC